MKHYPSIDKIIRSEPHIYAFEKLDGSQIRAEFSLKKGFYKFGSKKILIDQTSPQFGEAPELIKNKYEKDMFDIAKKQGWDNVVCFLEFLGPNSFAGFHFAELKDVVLFDVSIYKKGFLEPLEFINVFKDLHTPEVLYQGKATADFVASVRNSTVYGMPLEGVVCKGANDKKTKMPIMFKIKSQEWLDKLRQFCGSNDKLYKELF